LIHEFHLLTVTYACRSIVCGWFISGWLRITIQVESCDSSVFSSRFLHQRRSIISRCRLTVRISIFQEAVKGKMSIGCSITGGHRTSPNCLSWSRDRMTMPSTTRTWGGTTREGWLQYGTAWTLTSNWASRYRTPRSLWMSYRTYHIHIRLPERLALNQSIFS
jgi:hypothetical protein